MTTKDTADTSMRLDRTLDALAHHRRRRVLYHLREASSAMSAASLARALASDEDADAERVRASLHHRHLPKLADAGVVQHDARSGDVRYAGDDVVESWLDRLADVECVE